jgi:hypothetical protein
MRDLLLPLAVFALAGAVALHAVVPAIAEEPAVEPVAAPVPPVLPATAAPALEPECKAIRLGTAREVEKVMGELHASGRTQLLMVSSGLLCGWR